MKILTRPPSKNVRSAEAFLFLMILLPTPSALHRFSGQCHMFDSFFKLLVSLFWVSSKSRILKGSGRADGARFFRMCRSQGTEASLARYVSIATPVSASTLCTPNNLQLFFVLKLRYVRFARAVSEIGHRTDGVLMVCLERTASLDGHTRCCPPRSPSASFLSDLNSIASLLVPSRTPIVTRVHSPRIKAKSLLYNAMDARVFAFPILSPASALTSIPQSATCLLPEVMPTLSLPTSRVD
ncbi:hypothetical protein BDZ89DRAFT_288680 [Hymenopellis radicata]|nr:hypothetical protein BDZ89DRAFT_288680 [Hymenopellis radicata]